MLSASIFDRIDEQIAEKESRSRGHLGFRGIGDDDEYKQWMGFHWCLPSTFGGRMLRLFDLGNRIEDQVVDNIRDTDVISIASHDKDGNQFRASFFGGHFAGSCDGLLKGVFPPPSEEVVLLLEVKSANDKRFKELVKLQSYEAWSETYRWQIHAYMGALQLGLCMVVVVNKNTSEVYEEIIDFNPDLWEKAQARAWRIITSDGPNKETRMSEKDWRMKNESSLYRDIYYGRRLPESVNCRNCVNSKPLTDSNGAVWFCKRKNKSLTLQEQRDGCRDHMWIPALLNANHLPGKSTDDSMAYQVGIMEFYNSTSEVTGEYHYSSSEIRELSKADFDAQLMMTGESVRRDFPGSYLDNVDERKVPF